MNAEKIWRQNRTDEYNILDLWKMKNSQIVAFTTALEKTFNLVIDYRSGHIVKYQEESSPHFEKVKLRFVLNNEIIEAESIYYDDRQFLVRTDGDQRIRRMSLRTIKEVQLNGQVFNVQEFMKTFI